MKNFERWLVPGLVLMALLVVSTGLAQTCSIGTTTTCASNDFIVKLAGPKNLEDVFSVQWDPGGNPSGAPNLTHTSGVGICNSGDVEYWGNSWAPPDPQGGGLVLVGAGTVAGGSPAQQSTSAGIEIKSISKKCSPASANVHVQTAYTFFNSPNPSVNVIAVERDFKFPTPFGPAFRPYVPRLFPITAFSQVLYPSTSGTLVTRSDVLSSCPTGCTGPISEPGITNSCCSDWDSIAGWFAINNGSTGAGVIVKRQGNGITPQLWLDFDEASYTAASSFILLPPPGGFTQTVTEVESLCFYNSSIWPPASRLALTLPPGC